MQGILPALGGLMLYFAMLWSIKDDWNFGSDQSWTVWDMPTSPHWEIGGVFMIFFVTAVLGVVLMLLWRFASPSFFSGEVLNRATPTLVPDDERSAVDADRGPLPTSGGPPAAR